ncbi:MAG: DUF2281 domain-containing protein [Cyanophyceae cyanobacterium]
MNTAEGIPDLILQRIRQLSLRHQQEVLDFAEFLLTRNVANAEVSGSFLEAAQDWIGCVEAPEDLSTNPAHMEGFGG